MALQERIEQEMESNEMLEQVEVDENDPETVAVDEDATSSTTDITVTRIGAANKMA